jgi:uncharacterized membrane protein YeaQ/YmgE (transglycosylase-associated protein family)
MFRVDFDWGPGAHSLGSACAAAASAAATWLAVAAEAALQLFGVPLPVVLAALTGACGARVFLPPTSFARAAGQSLFWTIAGAIGAQFGLWLVEHFLDGKPPGSALAFVALVMAALGQRVAPILWVEGGAAFERWLRQWGGTKGGQ